MKSLELREQRTALLETATELLDLAEKDSDGVLSEERQATYDGLQEQIDKLATRIQNADKLEQARAAITETTRGDQPGREPEVENAAEKRLRFTQPARKLVAFKGDDKGAYQCGQWLRAQGGSEVARLWLRENRHALDFDLECPHTPYGGEQRVATIVDNTTGGFLVPDPLQNSIITLQDEYGVARRLCRRVPMTADTIRLPIDKTGLSATWTGETTTLTATDPALTQSTLVAKPLSVLVRVSNDLMEDSIIDLAEWVATSSARALAEGEDDSFINGDATSSYGGVYALQRLEANEAYQGVYTAASAANVDTYAEVAVSDLANTIALLPQYAYTGNGPQWLVSQGGRAGMFERLGQAGGGTSVVTIQNGLTTAYSGYPINISGKMPSGGDLSEQIMAFFGNFELTCAFGDRRSTSVQILRERFADSRQTGIIVDERVDITFYDEGDASTAGGVVGLMGD